MRREKLTMRREKLTKMRGEQLTKMRGEKLTKRETNKRRRNQWRRVVNTVTSCGAIGAEIPNNRGMVQQQTIRATCSQDRPEHGARYRRSDIDKFLEAHAETPD